MSTPQPNEPTSDPRQEEGAMATDIPKEDAEGIEAVRIITKLEALYILLQPYPEVWGTTPRSSPIRKADPTVLLAAQEVLDIYWISWYTLGPESQQETYGTQFIAVKEMMERAERKAWDYVSFHNGIDRSKKEGWAKLVKEWKLADDIDLDEALELAYPQGWVSTIGLEKGREFYQRVFERARKT